MSRKMFTLDDLKKGADSGSNGDKGKKDNEYYAGGASSGISVQGRGKRDEDEDAVSQIFKQQGVSGEGAKGSLVIKFYKNGFVVDDGEFRPLDAPENKAFVDAINQGRVPAELIPRLNKGEVDVAVEDHRGEDYVPPAYRAYSGAGNTMGSASAAPKGAVVTATKAAAAVTADPSQPTTTLQVRLLDGRRERVTLNLSHTVAHLQAVVSGLKGTTKPFILVAGFPPKPLDNTALTIEAAGLKGAAVTQQAA